LESEFFGEPFFYFNTLRDNSWFPDELGWLLRKLRTDGVDVKELGDFESADYGGELYEVTLDQ
jgi:hypothetical protein